MSKKSQKPAQYCKTIIFQFKKKKKKLMKKAAGKTNHTSEKGSTLFCCVVGAPPPSRKLSSLFSHGCCDRVQGTTFHWKWKFPF